MVAVQADLVAVRSDGQVTVYDVKTDAQRDSDVAQVMIYMYAISLATDSPWKDRSPDGLVVYGDGAEIYIHASAIDDDFREGLHDLIRRIVSDDPARRVPSPSKCNWCDLTELDCRSASTVIFPVRRLVLLIFFIQVYFLHGVSGLSIFHSFRNWGIRLFLYSRSLFQCPQLSILTRRIQSWARCLYSGTAPIYGLILRSRHLLSAGSDWLSRLRASHRVRYARHRTLCCHRVHHRTP